MINNLKNNYIQYLFLLFSFLFIVFALNPRIIEQDGYFHFSISKMMLDNGILRTLPQIDNIGWSKFFTDKEFFFHLLTAFSYFVFGETGIKILMLCFGYFSIILVYNILRKLQISTTHAFLFALLLCTQYTFSYRLPVIRPHVFVIFLAIINLYGFLFRNIKVILISTFLFPLSYHLPIVVLINLTFSTIFLKIKKKDVFFIVLAFIAGFIVHPNFPGNIDTAIMVYKAALNLFQIPAFDRPPEFTIPSAKFIWSFYLFVVVTLISLFKVDLTVIKNNQILKFISCLVFVWSILFYLNFRSIEYLFPVLVIFLALLSLHWNKKFVSYTLLLLNVLGFSNLYFSDFRVQTPNRYAEYDDKLNELSTFSNHQFNPSKIYNCSWADGQYILYVLPQWKFVDILTAEFLANYSLDLYTIKRHLFRGNLIDPYGPIKNVFHSDFVFCASGDLNIILENDPRFLKLSKKESFYMTSHSHEGIDTPSALIFKLRPEGNEPFITNPDNGLKYFTIQRSQISANCRTIKIGSNEIARRAGSKYLSIGGSSIPREISLNNQLLKYNKNNILYKGMISQMIKLPASLKENDLIEVKYCGLNKSENISIALWKINDIESYCAQRNNYYKTESALIGRNMSMNICSIVEAN